MAILLMHLYYIILVQGDIICCWITKSHKTTWQADPYNRIHIIRTPHRINGYIISCTTLQIQYCIQYCNNTTIHLYHKNEFELKRQTAKFFFYQRVRKIEERRQNGRRTQWNTRRAACTHRENHLYHKHTAMNRLCSKTAGDKQSVK